MARQKPQAARRPSQNGAGSRERDTRDLDDLTLLADMQAYLKQRDRGIHPPPAQVRASDRFIQLATWVIRGTLKNIRDRWLRDDLTQAALTAVLKGLPGFAPQGPRSVIAWLRTIARCLAATFCPPQPIVRCTAVPPEKLACIVADEPDPAATAASKEAADILEEKVEELRASLSPENQQILDEHVLGDRSAKKIGDETGLTEGAVRDRALRIRRRLRDRLPEP